MGSRIAIWLAALLFAAFSAVAVHAQDEAAEQLPEPLAAWDVDLNRIEKALAGTTDDEAKFLRLREELEAIRARANAYAKKVQEEYAATKSQLDRLGPAPKPEEPPESVAAATLRAQLSKKVAELDGVIRTAGVIQTRAGQIAASVQEQRRNRFSRHLFERVYSPFTLKLWSGVADYAAVGIGGVRSLLNDWWHGIVEPLWLLVVVGGVITVWAILFALCGQLIRRYRSYDGEPPPPFLRRAASAGGVTFARSFPHVAAALLLYAGLWYFKMLPARIEPLVIAVLTAFSAVVFLRALIKTVLAPNQPNWRILGTSDASARQLSWLASGVAVVQGLDLVLSQLAVTLDVPLPLTVAQSFLTTVAVAFLIAAMLRLRLGVAAVGGGDAMPGQGVLKLIRFALWICVIAIFVAACVGYIGFARFLMNQVVFCGALLILLYLLHVAIEDYSASLSNPERRAGRWLELNFQLDPQRRVQIGIIASAILHLLLVLVFAPLVLIQWGFDWEDLRVWTSKAIFGFEVGEWRISLATVFAALLIFLIGLFVTRLFQLWLDTRVLMRAQLEQGARSAVRTGIGYLGFAIAGLIAVSYAGLDFSNLAIVAGALSVGIGFGLQSIVNNFVSGLILLAERRISVGDWIIAGGEEGYVRRISVRATEIETFDRNFVIIPNSELMTSAVKNWTFQHRRARLTIDVGVSYNSDPRQVEKILLACANAHPAIIDHEKTKVWFRDFGDSALAFRLKAFVGDVTDLFDARSDLRYAIFEAFRQNGIEIPFPQRDFHLKDIDRLEAAMAGHSRPGAAEKRAAAKQTGRSRGAQK